MNADSSSSSDLIVPSTDTQNDSAPNDGDNNSSEPSSSSTNTDLSESNLPLSELRAKLNTVVEKPDQKPVQGKPYFKCTTYELYKYKHNHIFKCMKCDKHENSEKDINNHYRERHGKL